MMDFQLTSISSIDEPLLVTYPGQMLSFSSKFSSIPDKYRLQILDGKQNTRLNHYSRGSSRGINIKWPIPKTIRERHLGFWEISIDTELEKFQLLFEVKNIRNFFSCD